MQKKNNLLRPTHRSGMAMMMAIAILVVISTIMALSLSLSVQTAKKTTDLYLYEQSVLLSKSASEYALLKISQKLPCSYSATDSLTKIDYNDLNFVQDEFYDINISLAYIYTPSNPCSTNGGTLYTTVTTDEQNGSVVMDIRVSVPISKGISTEPIKYFKRTIQKL